MIDIRRQIWDLSETLRTPYSTTEDIERMDAYRNSLLYSAYHGFHIGLGELAELSEMPPELVHDIIASVQAEKAASSAELP